MKLKPTAILLAVAFLLQACTSTYDLTPTPQESHPWMETQYQIYAEFLAGAEGKTVRIVTSDGSYRLGRITRADADSINWTDAKDSLRHVLPTASVQSLGISHNYGFTGLLIGFLAPTIPNIVGGGLNIPREGNSSTPDWSGVRTTVTEAILGGVMGMLGGTLPHRPVSDPHAWESRHDEFPLPRLTSPEAVPITSCGVGGSKPSKCSATVD